MTEGSLPKTTGIRKSPNDSFCFPSDYNPLIWFSIVSKNSRRLTAILVGACKSNRACICAFTICCCFPNLVLSNEIDCS